MLQRMNSFGNTEQSESPYPHRREPKPHVNNSWKFSREAHAQSMLDICNIIFEKTGEGVISDFCTAPPRVKTVTTVDPNTRKKVRNRVEIPNVQDPRYNFELFSGSIIPELEGMYYNYTTAKYTHVGDGYVAYQLKLHFNAKGILYIVSQLKPTDYLAILLNDVYRAFPDKFSEEVFHEGRTRREENTVHFIRSLLNAGKVYEAHALPDALPVVYSKKHLFGDKPFTLCWNKQHRFYMGENDDKKNVFALVQPM